MIFAMTRNSERLHNSAGILGLEIPYTVAEIDAACNEVMKANGVTDWYVRTVAWRGPEQMGVAANRTNTPVAVACGDSSEEPRDGKECVRRCRSRCRPVRLNKKK